MHRHRLSVDIPEPEETLLAQIDGEDYTVCLPTGIKRPRVLLDNHRTSTGIPRRLVIQFSEDDARRDFQNCHIRGKVTVLKRNDSFLMGSRAAEVDQEMSVYASRKLDTDKLPPVDTLAAPKLCSSRLQHLISLLEQDSIVSKEDIINNLKYSISVLDTLYIEETKRLFDDDDALNEVEPDAVPAEVREWLAQTFTRSQSVARVKGDRPKFKSVANVVRAGLFVDRMYKRMTSFENSISPPSCVAQCLKDIAQWDFNVYELNEKTENHALKYMGYELLRIHGLIGKLKIKYTHLDNFLLALEKGYSRYGNPYHNLIHGADVAQTTYHLLQSSGLMRWLSDIEIFAVIIAALIHDYEHNGTTNNFHIMSSTPLTLLYNDKAVLENHHVCAAFELMRSDDKNIVSGLNIEEYREFRALVIDMVLSTDMSCHFQQLKNMKSMLSCPENLEKSKALCLVLHTADISHPSKPWEIHKRWTDSLIEEFFKQGDREKELGIPCSPLCDRQTTLVEKSQIGFIDFIVEPSFNILGDMMEGIIQVMQIESSRKGHTTIHEESDDSSVNGSFPATPVHSGDQLKFNRCWEDHISSNRKTWKSLAGLDEEENETKSETNGNSDNNGHKENGKLLSRGTSTTELNVNCRKINWNESKPKPRFISKQTSTTSLTHLTEYPA